MTTEQNSRTPTDPPIRPPRLYDALVTEHATIYGYGIVSAHSTPEDNYLVAQAMASHREQREALLRMLDRRSVTARSPPLAMSCR